MAATTITSRPRGLMLVLLLCVLVFLSALAMVEAKPRSRAAPSPPNRLQTSPSSSPPSSATSASAPPARVIVELESEPLVERLYAAPEERSTQARRRVRLGDDNADSQQEEEGERSPGWVWRMVRRDPEAREHAERMVNERNTFLDALTDELVRTAPAEERFSATAGHDLVVRTRDNKRFGIYSLLLNGVSLRVPEHYAGRTQEFIRMLKRLPHVTQVTQDRQYKLDLFASVNAINAAAAYAAAPINGSSNAGAGIKIASIDGGLYAGSPMFNGSTYSYPAGWPSGGLGQTSNNNGKIIASRVYPREDDPPMEGEENAYPGPFDSSTGNCHGVHTASTAGGEFVTGQVGEVKHDIHGVAPKAWLMSYRVFIPTLDDPSGTAADAELIMAVEDAVEDGANVIINSWGGQIPGVGEYAPLNRALINAVRAGLFLSMSAGNSGPSLTTAIDHSSTDYIGVAAATVSTYLSTLVSVVGAGTDVPSDVSSPLFGYVAYFGSPISVEPVTYEFVALEVVDPDNVLLGCWDIPVNVTDRIVLLPIVNNALCNLLNQAIAATNAGAALVIFYAPSNQPASSLMFSYESPGLIGSVLLDHVDGKKLVSWYYNSVNESGPLHLTVAFSPQDRTRTADVIADFSSRGPSVIRTLKPDIAAPGVDILAQGYAYGYTGMEAYRHYGTVSGTSMAAPHVAGAGALVKQLHPNWSPRQIKAALMGTARWRGATTETGAPAQPLDMGAGMLDLSKVADPGALLDPPSLSFGYLSQGQRKSITVTVANVGSTHQTFNISSAYSGTYASVQGISFTPSSLALNPGSEEQVVVSFDSSELVEDDHQGFLIFTSDQYEVSMPLWARVLIPTSNTVLLLNAMGDSSDSSILNIYTSTLHELGVPFHLIDGLSLSHSDLYWVSAYPVVIYFTGENGITYWDGGPTREAYEMLRQYQSLGGRLCLLGDTAIWTFEALYPLVVQIAPFYYDASISGNELPTVPFNGWKSAPAAFRTLSINTTNSPSAHYISELSVRSSGEEGPGEDIVPMLYYTMSNNEYQYFSGIVCSGMRSQPTLSAPAITFPGAALITGIGWETIASADERLKFAAASIAYLTEEVALNVTFTPTSNGDRIMIKLASLHSANSSLLTTWDASPASLQHTFTISLGDGTQDLSMTTTVTTVHALSDSSSSLSAEVVLEHCFAPLDNASPSYRVSVRGVSPFGNAAVWSGEVTASTTCKPPFSAGSRNAPSTWLSAIVSRVLPFF